MKKGTVHIIEDFLMPQLNRKRNLRIYLPPEYENSKDKYPVIYMHDAQNLFDVSTAAYGMIWDAANIADRLYNEEKIKGIIIVGIDNDSSVRYNEYSPWRNEEISNLLYGLKESTNKGGQGFEYIDFIVDTLKPYIDSNYKTLPDRGNTAIGGSSMGGYISLCAGIKYQNIFSKVAALSSAIWFSEEDIKKFIEITGKRDDMKIYMDIGTQETSNRDIHEFPQIYLNSNKNTYEVLKKVGFDDREVKFIVLEGAVHSEMEWALRLPEALEWLFYNTGER